jgi:DNA-binding GntR family transcriptional regulator
MSDWKEHCKDCKNAGLSKEWDVVHHWLDEFSKEYYPWEGHRIYRHHKDGIEEVRKKWGDEAAMAAEMHIKKDFGYIPESIEELEIKYGVKCGENKF